MELQSIERRLPDTRDAGLMYSVVAILFVFLGGRLARLGLPTDLYTILSEVLLIALPPILAARGRRFDIVSTFRLKKPRAVEVLLTVLLGPMLLIAGACAGFIALILIRNTFGAIQINSGITSMMDKGVIWSLLLIAVVPAVCEEILFRGFIQRGLEKMGAAWSIVLSGLFFGLFHFDFQRFAAQTLIGMAAAYVVYRTGSIFNGMILHFMNNGLATLIMNGNLPQMQNPDAMSQINADPFSSPEMLELADLYGMSLDELMDTLLITLSIAFCVCMAVIVGLLFAIRAATAGRVERPVKEEKAGRGLLLGIPALVLILTVYASIGLTLLNNPAGAAILRFLGL